MNSVENLQYIAVVKGSAPTQAIVARMWQRAFCAVRLIRRGRAKLTAIFPSDTDRVSALPSFLTDNTSYIEAICIKFFKKRRYYVDHAIAVLR